MSYSQDRQWSDRFIPDIRAKVGPLLLAPAPFEVDARQAADLIVLHARDMRIAARVRRHGYAHRYPFEFTIRAKRDSGQDTELKKLLDGFGDWMFYGHAAESAPIVERWMLIDLHVWRGHLLRVGSGFGAHTGGWRGLAQPKSNGDGTHFYAFDVRRFPHEMLIAGNVDLMEQGAA